MNLSVLLMMNLRHLVKRSIKDGRCAALNQYYQSSISDEVFIIISKELGVIGNMCAILDKYFEYTNQRKKIIENENDSQFKDYRIAMKKKQPNILTKNLTNYRYIKNYKN